MFRSVKQTFFRVIISMDFPYRDLYKNLYERHSTIKSTNDKRTNHEHGKTQSARQQHYCQGIPRARDEKEARQPIFSWVHTQLRKLEKNYSSQKHCTRADQREQRSIAQCIHRQAIQPYSLQAAATCYYDTQWIGDYRYVWKHSFFMLWVGINK